MNFSRKYSPAVVILFTALFLGFAGRSAISQQPDIIVTAAPVYHPLAALEGGERFPQGAQLLLIHAGKAQALLPSFFASADANISFDGKRVLFAGKHDATDPWQIWELSLLDHAVRKLVAAPEDAIKPIYLPFGRLVYAQHVAHRFELETAGKETAAALAPIDDKAGLNPLPLSYLSTSAIPADVLKDGRILFESYFPLGAGSTPELYLVYSDGSGVESYRCDHGKARWGGKQLSSGDLVFTHGSTLARFTSPLAHEAPVFAPLAEYAGAIAETATGEWLASARSGPAAHYALQQWKPNAGTAIPRSLQTVFFDAQKDIVEPVIVAPRPRPNRHPSGLHDWNYANLLALDARQSREGDLKTTPASVRLEMLDAKGRAITTGTATIESDGSFFVQAPADKPIRLSLLDAHGAVVRQEHGWFWIRSGEQRICTGCHTGPERASENRLPAVLLHSTTPTDLTGAKSSQQAQDRTPGGK